VPFATAASAHAGLFAGLARALRLGAARLVGVLRLVAGFHMPSDTRESLATNRRKARWDAGFEKKFGEFQKKG
jgi:hypothetical protein